MNQVQYTGSNNKIVPVVKLSLALVAFARKNLGRSYNGRQHTRVVLIYGQITVIYVNLL